MTTLTISRRFCGPAASANGGYFAGRLGVQLGGDHPVRVTLRRPPPLEMEIGVGVAADGVTATVAGQLVAEAELGRLTHDPVPAVAAEEAHAAMARYAGLQEHPFPRCFVCGPERPAPDGLGLRPGPVDGRPEDVATAWRPDASLASDGGVDEVFVWAALDCPGGWSAGLLGRPMVLGRMTAAVAAAPEVGDECVVVGRRVGGEGRKVLTLSTAYDGEGNVLGHAESVWIEVDPASL